jgi:NitT/TauT family transport system substrate-binding protein
MTRKVQRGAAVFAAVALVLAACGGDDDGADDAPEPAAEEPATEEPTTTEPEADEGPTTVRFLKSNSWDAGTGGAFFSAVEEGFFEEEGIVAEPVISIGAATGIAALVSGSAEMAQSTPDAMMNGIAQGADLVAVWGWLETGVFGTLVNTSAGINSLADLEGKTIGIINRQSTTLFSTQLELAQEGLTEEDVEIVALSCCAAQFTEMVNGNVDAIGTWDGQYLTLQQTAEAEGETEWFDQTEIYWNEDYLGDIIVTTRSFLEENEDVVVGFLRGLWKGQQFQLDNIEAATQNAADNVEGVEVNENSIAQAELRANSWNMTGDFDLTAVEESLLLYNQIGLIGVHPGAIDLARVFINEVPTRVTSGS